MASFQTITRKNGNKSYRAFVKHGPKTFTKQFRKMGDARAWANELEGNKGLLESSPDAVARKMTLDKAIDSYMENEAVTNLTVIGQFKWWSNKAGHLKLSQITAPLVNQLLIELKGSEAQHYLMKGLGRPRSPATVNRYRQALSSLMTYAVKKHWIANNPVSKVDRLKEPKGIERFLVDKERADLLNACKQQKWKGLYVIVNLALATGARRAELSGLTWDRVDFKLSTMTLTETKNGHTRTVPIIPSALVVLKEWAKVRRLDTDLVFYGRYDRTKPREFEEAWQRAMADAGVKNFRFHDLRHSCASYLAQSNVSLIVIAEILGHKSLTTTQRYAHLTTAAQAEALIGALEGKL